MDVTVIIVSYNVASFLDQALVTLERATDGLDTEVFVVDNASADGSADMVLTKHPWVTLIESGGNLGFARANNLALVRATGRYILLLNPDTVVRPDTLTTMVAFLDAHHEAGAAGCRVLNPDGTLQLACRRGFPSPGVAFYKLVGLSGLFPRSRTLGAYNMTWLDPNKTAEVDAVSGSFMMIRRDVLDRIGFLDETFFMYGEDLDICYRIRQDGWKIYYVPDTEIIHFKGESTKTVPSAKSIRDFYTAMRIFVVKHYGHHHRFVPRQAMIAGIYASMAGVYLGRLLKRNWQPLLDLTLLSVSLILGILLRFGLRLEHAPAYSNLEWVSIFVVSSALYMGSFLFIGIYHRYRYDPVRTLEGVFFGFLFNVLIVYFAKGYNFSRIASFYVWGLNSILLSGWRFLYQVRQAAKQGRGVSHRAVIVGPIIEAQRLCDRLIRSRANLYDIVGCVETTPGALRGTNLDRLYVLGLVEDLSEVVRDYTVDTVIMVGAHVPFSRILYADGWFGVGRPDFKLVPETGQALRDVEDESAVTMFDINPSRTIDTGR